MRGPPPPQENIGTMRQLSSAHDATAKPCLLPAFRARTATTARARIRPNHKTKTGKLGIRRSTSGKIKDGAVVEIVSVEVVELEPGVTLRGENEQEASEGNPDVHASDTWPLKPTAPCGAIVIV